MRASGPGGIRAIVFDLDGTLYVHPSFAATIQDAAVGYMAGVMGVALQEAAVRMAAARSRIIEELGAVPTLSSVCVSLGGDIPGLHRFFGERLRPESYLLRDERVADLLQRLGSRCRLFVYTNNNLALSMRIMACLGIEERFERIFAIDDQWRPKPDAERVKDVLALIGGPPEQVLFVGDRYEVDLRLPEQMGCPVFLSQSVEQLLRLDELIR